MSAIFPDLRESHRNRIRITLTLLDEALVAFAEWARGREARAVLFAEENDLTPRQQETILVGVHGIRQIMQEMRNHLELDPNPRSVAKNILASCYILWVDVLEMTGKYLKGLGEPSQELVDYLDPNLQKIMQYLDQIKVSLSEPPGQPLPPGSE
jgi:hypothetical protein